MSTVERVETCLCLNQSWEFRELATPVPTADAKSHNILFPPGFKDNKHPLGAWGGCWNGSCGDRSGEVASLCVWGGGLAASQAFLWPSPKLQSKDNWKKAKQPQRCTSAPMALGGGRKTPAPRVQAALNLGQIGRPPSTFLFWWTAGCSPPPHLCTLGCPLPLQQAGAQQFPPPSRCWLLPCPLTLSPRLCSSPCGLRRPEEH